MLGASEIQVSYGNSMEAAIIKPWYLRDAFKKYHVWTLMMKHHGIIENLYLHFINTLWYLNTNINMVIKQHNTTVIF